MEAEFPGAFRTGGMERGWRARSFKYIRDI